MTKRQSYLNCSISIYLSRFIAHWIKKCVYSYISSEDFFNTETPRNTEFHRALIRQPELARPEFASRVEGRNLM